MKQSENKNFNYPVAINGRMKFQITIPDGVAESTIHEIVSEQGWAQNITIKKIIIFPRKMINIVI